MPLDLADYERKARESVTAFWESRDKAARKQRASGNVDRGTRGSVTAGNNMDGFAALVIDLVKANGLGHADIHQKRVVLTLPGYFRPTKLWDLLVINQGRLVAAIEMKSQVGSFGNNFNNRAEESIGSAHDFWTAYREGALGKKPRPFLGWLMLVEDAPGSRSPVRDKAPHYPVFPEFQGASYLKRYDLLCQRLVREQLYTAAAVMASPRDAVMAGAFSDISDLTSRKMFITSLAGHVAVEASR